jgi:hypothetical protein
VAVRRNQGLLLLVGARYAAEGEMPRTRSGQYRLLQPGKFTFDRGMTAGVDPAPQLAVFERVAPMTADDSRSTRSESLPRVCNPTFTRPAPSRSRSSWPSTPVGADIDRVQTRPRPDAHPSPFRHDAVAPHVSPSPCCFARPRSLTRSTLTIGVWLASPGRSSVNRRSHRHAEASRPRCVRVRSMSRRQRPRASELR